MPKKIAYSYIRFSSKKQEKGHSLERQEDMRNDWLKDNSDYEQSPMNYNDLAMSGYSGVHKDKGKLGSFLEYCKNESVPQGSVLLVESIDRLGRLKPKTMFDLIFELTEFVDVITLEDNQRYTPNSLDNYQGHTLLGKIQQAHNYSKELSRRLTSSRKNTREKALNGEVNKVTKNCPNWIKWSEDLNQFKLIDDKAKIVKKIFSYYVNDGLGTTAIASRLTNEGVAPFNAKRWHGSYINKILFDRKAIGELHLNQRKNSSEYIENYYPLAISRSIFNEAKEIKESKFKTFRTNSSNKPYDIYNGIVYCCCGHKAKLYNKGKGYFIYQCGDRVSGKCKQSRGLSKEDLLTHIGSYLDYRMIKRGVEQLEKGELTKLSQSTNERESLEKQEQKLRKELKVQRDDLKKAIDEIESKEIQHEIEDTRSEIDKVKARIEQLENQQGKLDSIASVEMADIGNYSADWWSYIYNSNTKSLLSELQYININNLLIDSGARIVLHQDKTVLLSVEGKVKLRLVKKRLSSKATTSYLGNGAMHIKINDKNERINGAGFKRIELIEDGGLVYPNIYFTKDKK